MHPLARLVGTADMGIFQAGWWTARCVHLRPPMATIHCRKRCADLRYLIIPTYRLVASLRLNQAARWQTARSTPRISYCSQKTIVS